MKVILGNLKGKSLAVPPGIRPMSNMVKKACFDILKDEVEGKRVLELFSGSGALGIESLSLGAREAVFIDIDRRCVSAIKKNIYSLDLSSKASVFLKDAISAINDFCVYREKFDIIFLDPPYNQGGLINALQSLSEYDILTLSGYIISFCYVKDEYLENSDKLSIILEKKYGQTLLLIYKKS